MQVRDHCRAVSSFRAIAEFLDHSPEAHRRPSPPVPDRVLVIEDDPKVANALRDGLRTEGYHTEVAETGPEGMARASTEPFHLILLDRSLPGLDGLDLLRALRTQGVRTPVIMVTAKDSVDDRVQGLDTGADDYLVKPFAFEELLARMRTLLRPARASAPVDVRVAFEDLEMDLLARTVTRGETSATLTGKEFQVLAYLVQHAGTVVSRDALAHDAWTGFERNVWLNNVIDVHIARIRKKVDADHAVKLIHTVKGVGFIVRRG